MYQRNRSYCGLVSGVVLAASLLASFSTLAFEELGKIKLEPAENPGPIKVGLERHYLRNGEPNSFKVTALEDGVYSGITSDGCEFSTWDETWGPSKTWKNCRGNSGSHTMKKVKGSPWPMKVKKKFSFTFSGISDKGDTWKGYRRCKVKKAVRVKVPAGEYDTFKFVCSVDWETKTYWYAPELGHSVAVKRVHKHNSSKNYFSEFVREG